MRRLLVVVSSAALVLPTAALLDPATGHAAAPSPAEGVVAYALGHSALVELAGAHDALVVTGPILEQFTDLKGLGRPMVVDLYDPDSYVGAPPHDVLAELRRTQPVYFQSMADEPGYWMVLKHSDVVHVAREPKLFSDNCSSSTRPVSDSASCLT